MNQFLVFSAFVIILGGEFFHGINGQEFTIETANFTGKWYAVMSTGCSDGKDCNIFTNNESPCQCISAYFRPLQDVGWQVYISAVNNQSSIVTIDMGAAALTPSDSTTNIQGFIYSRATMPLSVITDSKCGITQTVSGQKFFLRYKMTIIGSSIQYGYIINTMTQIDGNDIANGNPLTVVWCRNKTPGKKTIWTQIVKHFQSLNLDIHQLKFINQLNCKYPTNSQYNEIFFC